MKRQILFPAIEMAVGFPVINSDVLLSVRRRALWFERLSGLGGKKKKWKDKNIFDTLKRETKEEGKIIPIHMEKRAEFQIFCEGQIPIKLHAIVIYGFDGTPTITEEMGPHLFFPVENLPIRHMIPGDEYWVYRMLKGEFLKGEIYRSADAEKLLSIDIRTCTGF